MSISSEITRLTNARNNSFTAIGNKGVTVPSGSTMDDMSGLIDDIDAIKTLPSVPVEKDSSIIKVGDAYYAWKTGSGIYSRGYAEVPYKYDYNKGYVSNGVWYFENPSNTYVDIYEIRPWHHYFFSLGKTTGSIYRVMILEDDPTGVTTQAEGTSLVDWGDDKPAEWRTLDIATPWGGYVIVAKDNEGTSGIRTYLYDKDVVWT